jgi:hypothetical protein
MFNLLKRNPEAFHVAGTSAKETSRVSVTEPVVVVGWAELAWRLKHRHPQPVKSLPQSENERHRDYVRTGIRSGDDSDPLSSSTPQSGDCAEDGRANVTAG